MSVAQIEKQKLITADELFRMPASERYELLKGVLIPMSPPPGSEHGSVVNQFNYLITHHAVQNRLGRVFAAETGFRLARDPDTVRAADIAFVAQARLPVQLPKGYLDFAPDLVGEVASPSDKPDDIQSKVKDWLDGGARVVVVVYPGARQVTVYRSLREVTILTEADTFTAPDILPGLSCPVADILA